MLIDDHYLINIQCGKLSNKIIPIWLSTELVNLIRPPPAAVLRFEFHASAVFRPSTWEAYP